MADMDDENMYDTTVPEPLVMLLCCVLRQDLHSGQSGFKFRDILCTHPLDSKLQIEFCANATAGDKGRTQAPF